MLGHHTHHDWHGGFGSTLLSGNMSSGLIYGQAYVNGVSEAPGAIQKPSTFKLLSFVSAANVNVSTLTNDRGIGNRNWDGDYAEVIMYDWELSITQRQQVEEYLRLKYNLY